MDKKNEWRHMNEAPKDGRSILLFCWNNGDHYICIGRYAANAGLFLASFCETKYYDKPQHPAAWMELPDHPGLPPYKIIRSTIPPILPPK